MTGVKDFIRRLCKNRLTVVCLILFVLIVLAVIFANFIAPYGWDEGEVVNRYLACLLYTSPPWSPPKWIPRRNLRQ